MVELTRFGICDAIEAHARFRGMERAFQMGSTEWSWRRLGEVVAYNAEFFARSGVRAGDTVAVLTGTSPWGWGVILGALRSGAVVAPLSPLATAPMLARFLSDCGAKVLVASSEWYALASEAVAAAETVCLVGQSDADTLVEASGTPRGAAPLLPATDGDRRCVIIYSSGTTGRPKGIVHTHDSRLNLAFQIACIFRITASATTLVTTPPHTNGTWMMMLPTLLAGGRVVFMPRFEAGSLLAAVREQSPTHAFLVPTQWRAILEHESVDAADWSVFDAIVTAGAPMPAAMKAEVRRRTGDRLFELWGHTEGAATVQPPECMARRPDAVGRPMPGCEIRIVGAQGQDITGAGSGEIVGRSISQMECYLGRPEDTGAVRWTDSAGREFIRTGDVGEVDEEGYLVLRGRLKEMILSGGLNVYPVDIEAVLLTHPEVRDAAVIGVPDERWGETPVAFVAARGPAPLDRDALLLWSNRQLAKYQRLSDLVIVSDDLPRNTLGKVVKPQLRELYGRTTQ